LCLGQVHITRVAEREAFVNGELKILDGYSFLRIEKKRIALPGEGGLELDCWEWKRWKDLEAWKNSFRKEHLLIIFP
jgi:hypothetical protein